MQGHAAQDVAQGGLQRQSDHARDHRRGGDESRWVHTRLPHHAQGRQQVGGTEAEVGHDVRHGNPDQRQDQIEKGQAREVDDGDVPEQLGHVGGIPGPDLQADRGKAEAETQGREPQGVGDQGPADLPAPLRRETPQQEGQRHDAQGQYHQMEPEVGGEHRAKHCQAVRPEQTSLGSDRIGDGKGLHAPSILAVRSQFTVTAGARS